MLHFERTSPFMQTEMDFLTANFLVRPLQPVLCCVFSPCVL